MCHTHIANLEYYLQLNILLTYYKYTIVCLLSVLHIITYIPTNRLIVKYTGAIEFVNHQYIYELQDDQL